jgi:ComF family protein
MYVLIAMNLNNLMPDFLIDFIFPKTSVLSDERIYEVNSNQYLNDEELTSLNKVTVEDLLDLKLKVNSDFSFSCFAFREGDEFSKLIYQLKYGGMRNLGVFLGETLGREIKKFFESENIKGFELLIPVPLHKTKKRERGYNQSDYICKGITNVLSLEFAPDLIRRVKHTPSQTKLNKEERIDNMKDAFEINALYLNRISQKRVILVDDVVTTGSTLNEVINVLRETGCGDVFACTLAMAR